MNYKLLLLAAGVAPLSLSAANEQAKQNVILILVDDMGYSDLGCYGNTRINTPNIDKLAAEGMKFTDFHSNGPVSSPTRAALITGRYQQCFGIEGVITAASHREKGLDPNTTTMADIFKSNGYETIMYGKWHLGYDVKCNPRNYGFDDFIGFVAGNVDYFSHIDQEGYEDWWHQGKLKIEDGYTTELLTDHTVKYLEKKKKKPFFLYLPFEAPHAPFQGPNDTPVREYINGEYVTHSGRKDIDVAYKEMIESLDDCVGRIMLTLKEQQLDENTIILFCSDNGGTKYADNGPWVGYKSTLLEGGHRVPAIAYWPGRVAKGSICHETLLTMDMLPTLCEATNTPMTIDSDGESFLQTMLNGTPMVERTLFWRYANSVVARNGRWKYTLNRKTKVGKLIDISVDFKEAKDLSSQYPEIVESLREDIEKWESQFEGVDKQS